MQVINRRCLIWPKKIPEKITDLEKLLYVLGNEEAYHFFLGVLGHKPPGSETWKRYEWATFLKTYIYDLVTGESGEAKMIREFNRVFFGQGCYYDYLEQQWYV